MNATAGQNGEKMVCVNCGFVYDPAVGDPDREVAAGTNFSELPTDWVCPICYAQQDMFDLL